MDLRTHVQHRKREVLSTCLLLHIAERSGQLTDPVSQPFKAKEKTTLSAVDEQTQSPSTSLYSLEHAVELATRNPTQLKASSPHSERRHPPRHQQTPKENPTNSAYLRHPPNLHRLHLAKLPHPVTLPPPLKTGVFLLLILASRKRNYCQQFRAHLP